MLPKWNLRIVKLLTIWNKLTSYNVLTCVGGKLDYMRAAEHFIVKYRAGKLGRMTLDNISDLNCDHL